MLGEINNELEYVERETLAKTIEDLTEKILELYKTETKSIILKEDTVILNVEKLATHSRDFSHELVATYVSTKT